jgi:hypothetical protein
VRAIVLALFVCARAAAPVAETSPLEGCIPETREGATTYSCGAAFLAMDADVKDATDDAIAQNLNAFVEPFGKDVVARDDAPLVVDGKSHRAVRVRVDMPEKGKFVATMVVIRKGTGARVISCSAKDTEASRCDRVLQHLGSRAMKTP